MLNIWRISWRNHTQNKKRFLFTLTSIILGIAFVTAMLIAHRTTNDVFQYYKQMYVGNADYWILSDSHTFDVHHIKDVLTHSNVSDALVVRDLQAYFDIDNDVSLNQRAVRITGVSDQRSSLLTLPVIEGSLDNQGLVIPENVARLLNKQVGDTLTFSNLGTAKISAIVAYTQLLASPNDWDGAEAKSFRVMAPLTLLQDWTNQHNQISYVRFKVQNDHKSFFQSVQQQLKGTDLFVQPVVADDLQSNDISGLYTFFYLIAGLAIFISGFIVFNMIYTSVIERKREFAVMKSIGFTQAAISRLILSEILLLAIFGILIGTPIGILLGDFFLKALFSLFEFDMTYTLNWQLPVLLSCVLGFIFPILFALFPIVHAGKTPILLSLKNQVSPSTSKWFYGRIIIGILLLSFVLIDHIVSFFAVLIGMICLSPLLLIGVSRVSERILGISGKLAARNLTQQLNRNANTVAILSTTIAVIVLLGSIVSTAPQGFEKEIRDTFGGDLRITSEIPWTKEAIETLRTYDEIKKIDRISEATPITWETIEGELRQFSIMEVNEKGPQLFQHPQQSALFQHLQNQPSIVLGERAFQEWGGQIGQSISVHTPNGTQQLTVVDVVKTAHYTGYVGFLHQSYFRSEFGWTNSFDLVLQLHNPQDTSIRDQLRSALKDHLVAIQFVEEEIEATTSAIKGMNDLLLILLIVIIGLASIGTANTLLMNILERVNEIGTMRAIGFTKTQLMKMILIEGTLIGGIGMIGGVLTNLLFIRIASQSTLLEGFFSPHLPVHFLLIAAIASLLLSLGAAWIASRSVNQKNVQLLLRESR